MKKLALLAVLVLSGCSPSGYHNRADYEALSQKAAIDKANADKASLAASYAATDYRLGKNKEHQQSPFTEYRCRVSVDLVNENVVVHESDSTGTIKEYSDNRIEWSDDNDTSRNGLSDVLLEDRSLASEQVKYFRDYHEKDPTTYFSSDDYNDPQSLNYSTAHNTNIKKAVVKAIWKTGRINYVVPLDSSRTLKFSNCKRLK